MIGIKVVAIALTGLGGATVGSDVYLSARARSAVHTSWQHSSEVYRPVVRMGAEPVLPDSQTPGSVVVLSPVTIYARTSTSVAPPVVGARNSEPPYTPAVCSDWALHEDGVNDPGNWTLCIPSGASP